MNALQAYKGNSTAMNNLCRLSKFDPSTPPDDERVKAFSAMILSLDDKIAKSKFRYNHTLYRGMDVDIFTKSDKVNLTAFTSTSKSEEIAKTFTGENDKKFIYKINVIGDVKMIEIPRKIGNEISEENEILLQRNIVMNKKSNYEVNGFNYIDVEVYNPNPNPSSPQIPKLTELEMEELCRGYAEIGLDNPHEIVDAICEEHINDNNLDVKHLLCVARRVLSKQNGGVDDKVLVLSRWRKVVIRGHCKYVNVKGSLIPLTRARKIKK